MYEQFYNLAGSPFRLTPDHKFYFYSDGHRKAMSYLKYGLYQGEGFIVISGEVGLGKSTLVAQLLQELNPAEVRAIQIGTTQVDGEDAIRLICQTIGLPSERRSKAELLHEFEKFLAEEHRNRRRVLLIVDEAQNLPLPTLEELRMLSNFQLDGQPLMQGFLLGQPPFLDTLTRPDLAQLQQRVIASYQLQPMSEAETEEYVRHRLETAGWDGRDPLFTAGAYSAIHRETQGVPRRINALCNRILLYGALEQLHEVDVRVVDAVIEDLLGEAVSPLDRRGRGGTAQPPAEGADGAGAAGAPQPSAPLQSRLDKLEETLNEHDVALRELIDVAISQFDRLGEAQAATSSEPVRAVEPDDARREAREDGSEDDDRPTPAPWAARPGGGTGREAAAPGRFRPSPEARAPQRGAAQRRPNGSAGPQDDGFQDADEPATAPRRPVQPPPTGAEAAPRERRGWRAAIAGSPRVASPAAHAHETPADEALEPGDPVGGVDPWGDDPWEAEARARGEVSPDEPFEPEEAPTPRSGRSAAPPRGLFGGVGRGVRAPGARPAADPEIDPWAANEKGPRAAGARREPDWSPFDDAPEDAPRGAGRSRRSRR
ncbi:MAG: AAA family ATPase [Pseudomonadota bacterium]